MTTPDPRLDDDLPEDAIFRHPVEHWRDAKQTPGWLFAGARAGNLWPVGLELTERDYDAAIHQAANATVR